MPAFRRVLRVLPHLLAVTACAGACAIVASAADTAVVTTDRGCYLEQRQVTLTGAGYTPGASYTVVRDGQPIGGGTVGADGTVSGTFGSDGLPSGIAERSYDLSVSDGTNQAATAFRVSAFRALFEPARGDPARLRVRFSVFGFLTEDLPVYLHYVRPTGGVARTLRLGTTRGPCGSLPRTRLRRLFPFRAAAGRWLLQFDTHLSYRSAAVPRIVRAVTVRRRKS